MFLGRCSVLGVRRGAIVELEVTDRDVGDVVEAGDARGERRAGLAIVRWRSVGAILAVVAVRRHAALYQDMVRGESEETLGDCLC